MLVIGDLLVVDGEDCFLELDGQNLSSLREHLLNLLLIHLQWDILYEDIGVESACQILRYATELVISSELILSLANEWVDNKEVAISNDLPVHGLLSLLGILSLLKADKSVVLARVLDGDRLDLSEFGEHLSQLLFCRAWHKPANKQVVKLSGHVFSLASLLVCLHIQSLSLPFLSVHRFDGILRFSLSLVLYIGESSALAVLERFKFARDDTSKVRENLIDFLLTGRFVDILHQHVCLLIESLLLLT